MEVKKAVVLGLGSIASRHRKNIRFLFPGALIYAMSASGRPALISSIEDCDGILESVADVFALNPDFVVIASPATLHYSHALKAISANIPVLIEKPLTADLEEALSLLRVVSDPSKKLIPKAQVAYCLRFLPSAKIVHDYVSNARLGRLLSIQIDVGQYLPDWRPDIHYQNTVSANESLGGGALNELSHELDYAQWLFGKLILLESRLKKSTTLSLDVEDVVDLFCETEDGVVVSIHLDFIQRVPRRRCLIIAEGATLEWNLIENSVVCYDEKGLDVVYSDPSWDKNIMYLDMLTDFLAGETNCAATLPEAVEVVRFIDSVKKNIGDR